MMEDSEILLVTVERGTAQQLRDVLNDYHSRGIRINANATNDRGDSALMLAARRADEGMVRALLEARASVNHRNIKGSSPLVAAAMRGAASIVRLFINEGANVNAETETKDTALSLAVWKNHTDCAVLLMDARASVDRQDNYGDTMLLDAAFAGNSRLLAHLLQYNINVNHQNFKGETALLRAAWKGNAASVSLLLRHGASVQLCNKAGHTPLIIASLHGNYGTVKALLTFSTSKGPKSTDAAESSGPNSDPGIDNGSGGTLVRRTGLTHASANGEGRPPVLPSDIGQQDIATNNRTQAQPPSAAPSTPSSSTLRLRRSLTPSVTATGPGHVHNADNANTEAGGQTGSATESKMNSSTCSASNKSTEHGRGGGAADADNDDGISGSMNRNMSVCNTDTSQEPREVTPADDDGESDLANEEDASGHQHRESQSDGKTHASSQQGGNQTGMENQNPVRCHSGGINVNGEGVRRGVRERGEGWEAKMAGAMEGLGDGLGGGGRAVRAEGCDVEAGSQQEEQMVAVTSDLLNVRDNEGKTAIMYLALRSPQNIYWEGVTLCLHRGAIVRGGLGDELLCKAAVEGELECAKALIYADADVNFRHPNFNYQTCLLFQIRDSREQTMCLPFIQLLVTAQANVNLADVNGVTPLMAAIEQQCEEDRSREEEKKRRDKQRRIKKNKRRRRESLVGASDIDTDEEEDDEGMERLETSPEKLDILSLLLRKGASVHTQDSQGQDALSVALKFYNRTDQIEVLEVLAEEGGAGICENMLLINAAKHGNLMHLKDLLEDDDIDSDEDSDAYSDGGGAQGEAWTKAADASTGKSTSAATGSRAEEDDYEEEEDASFSSSSFSPLSHSPSLSVPLRTMTQEHAHAAPSLSLEGGQKGGGEGAREREEKEERANIDHVDDRGMNAVMYASLHGHKRCVEYLIEMGADLLHRDREGSTALILAIRHGQPGIAEVIALHVQLPRYTMTSTHHHFRPQHDAHMRGMASSSTSAAASSQAAPPASAISVTKDPALSSPSSSSREVLGRITAQTEGMNTGTGTDTSTAHVPAPATRASHTPHTPHAPHAPHASHAPSMSVPSQHYIPVDTEYRNCSRFMLRLGMRLYNTLDVLEENHRLKQEMQQLKLRHCENQVGTSEP